MGERLNGIQEVVSSNLIVSTIKKPQDLNPVAFSYIYQNLFIKRENAVITAFSLLPL